MRLGVGFAVLIASASACGDEYVPAESECQGDQVVACTEPADGPLAHRTFNSPAFYCPYATCTNIVDEDGLRQAVCSDSGQLDPRCDDRNGSLCLDSLTILNCRRDRS